MLTGPEPKLQASSNGPRRTTSQRKRSSYSISRGVPRGSLLRAAISSRYRRASPWSARRVSLERSKVRGSSGSGTSAANWAKAANSLRRPSRVASAMSGSMWLVKY